MSNYSNLVTRNKDKIVIEVIKVIHNETLVQTYSIYTNLHVDFGICDGELFNNFSSKSKGAFNRRIALFKRATGKNLVLYKTDNDQVYTRLIYRFK